MKFLTGLPSDIINVTVYVKTESDNVATERVVEGLWPVCQPPMYLRGSPSPPTSICLVPQWINFTQSASNISQKENSYDVLSIELPERKERVGYRPSPTTETPFNVEVDRLSESTLPSISINLSFGQSHVARAYELLHSLPVENM
ncbi:uncharacterized protein LOC118441939 [Vespa mandarinia]|uniref:uncharacterized protein LOC118441939 n=1 Tax=Vespa mandarinia TaxID=7446 RepID=UPI00161748DA|nr:uncharacterized protein LOC118441939 [Vespa mandarinia]